MKQGLFRKRHKRRALTRQLRKIIMKVFVTGATGLIGGLLVRRLRQDGHDVSILRRTTSDASLLADLPITHHIGDITAPATLKGIMKGCEILYQVAGLVAQWSGHRSLLDKTNKSGALNILEAALEQGVKRAVLVSSTVTIGATRHPGVIDEHFPFNLGHLPYAKAKWEMEQAAKEICRRRLEVVIVNPATTFGPGDKHVNAGRILLNTHKGKMFGYPPGGNTVVDASDVVDGMIVAMEKGRAGERYILGNEHLSYQAILSDICEIMKKDPPRVRLPKWFLLAGGWANELISHRVLRREPYPSMEAIDMSVRFMYLSSNKARRELGYAPKVDFKTSVQVAYDWYVKNDFQLN